MLNIPIRMIETYQSEVMTLSYLWKCTRMDGQVFGFTDADVDITFDGVLYKSSSAITPSATATQSSLAVNNLEVKAILDDETITESDLMAGLWNNAQIFLYQCDYRDITKGVVICASGQISDITINKTYFSTELRSLSQLAQNNVGTTYTTACTAILGDSKCRVNLEPFTVTGTIQDDTYRDRITDSSRTEEENWFQNGVITITSGLNQGYKQEVKSNKDGVIYFQLPFPHNFEIGDTYTVYAGCNKTMNHCHNKFNNRLNHRGFPFVPSLDVTIGNN